MLPLYLWRYLALALVPLFLPTLSQADTINACAKQSNGKLRL